jgi:hypothetical protein
MKKLLIITLFILQNFILYGQTEFISPDGKKRVVINKTEDKKYQVVVNSIPHKSYREIVNQKIYFFSDSSRVAYIAKCDNGRCVVVDGIEQPHYFLIYKNKLTLSPDSSHLVYMAIDNKEWFYIIDGIEQPHYDAITNKITFSPDSKHWAYAAINDNKWFYIIDGIEQPHYYKIHSKGLIFSNDSRHWAYGARNNDGWICVSDENESANDTTDICKEYLLSTTITKEETGTNIFFSAGPSTVSIGGDFDGKSLLIHSCPAPSFVKACLIPKIQTSIGIMINCGIVWRFGNSGIGLEYSYIKSKNNSSWQNNYNMKVVYTGRTYRIKYIHWLTNNFLWDVNLSFPDEKIEINDSEIDDRILEDTNEFVFIGNVKLENQGLLKPLNIGSRFGYYIQRKTMIYFGIDYQIKSKYKWGNWIGKSRIYSIDGKELSSGGCLSSRMFNISTGIQFYIF